METNKYIIRLFLLFLIISFIQCEIITDRNLQINMKLKLVSSIQSGEGLYNPDTVHINGPNVCAKNETTRFDLCRKALVLNGLEGYQLINNFPDHQNIYLVNGTNMSNNSNQELIVACGCPTQPKFYLEGPIQINGDNMYHINVIAIDSGVTTSLPYKFQVDWVISMFLANEKHRHLVNEVQGHNVCKFSVEIRTTICEAIIKGFKGFEQHQMSNELPDDPDIYSIVPAVKEPSLLVVACGCPTIPKIYLNAQLYGEHEPTVCAIARYGIAKM